ncbi:carbohydrate ABC transporter permease [Bauldia litoralis]|uniref:Multiple sugar transport system permease protein n=1 Tax=Bauldia litoralis TaxID=665467 RepID=A0A1G6BRW6_9HYPH|nr:carbohydrate ABC transporter permease [Bauldia litoralis]SDB23277.1 multiple sugar transport system permease protein [Bauldia litoralis]
MIVTRRNPVTRLVHALRWAAFIVIAFILNLPILATIMTSFKTTGDINTSPPVWIFTPTLSNYEEVLFAGNTNLPEYIFNSIAIAGGGTILAMLLTFPAAYAMVRYDIGKSWLLPLVTNVRALPLIIYAIPIYLMFQMVGLLDTRTGMALIACVINIPVALVLFVGFLQEIPEEMDAAAKIDGAGKWGILWHIILPLSRPILFAVLVLSFVYSWNEFLFGLILTTKNAVPVTVGATFFVTSYGVKWGATAAAMTLGIVPPMILGLFAYPYIGKSMLAGALKG